MSISTGLSISPGNTKMGSIQSVSLPAGATCRKDCPCYKKCYARRLAAFRKSMRDAYLKNYKMLTENPKAYWAGVEYAVATSRLFRFHVSGDIPDGEYFRNMVAVAERNPHCDILVFTKKYELVNEAVKNGTKVPKNLHIMFSAWQGLQMDNPNAFPEVHVRFKDGTTTARPGAKECGGNCTMCSLGHTGCWTLKSGEQLVINEH